MVHTDAGARRKVFQVSVLQKRLAYSTNLLWSVTDPPEARMRVLVEMQPEGKATVWVASSDARTGASVLPKKRWAEPILGSHLTVEDLVEEYFTWPKQSLLREENLGGRACYVLRSDSDAEHPSTYESVLAWIDRATFLPLQVQKIPPGSGPRKEVVCSGLRLSGGHWVTSSAKFQIKGTPGSTRIVFTGGTQNARIQDREVDPKVALGASALGH
jgi:hypothetical protein